MIKEVHGDILLSSAQAIAHGVSPNDNFGQGLALSLRERWPALYKDFRHYCHTAHPKAGEVWVWAGADGKRIANLLTQEAAYGHGERPGEATLPNVNHALRALARVIESEGLTSIALPRLATGVGRLQWEQVRPLIDEHLGALPVSVYLYTLYEKDVRASED
ncbi:MAG: macro domain-containing protein [Gammaproteobacteria bacterium]|jgi:O-acetyl-ADP-ribose deacetylase (regulator of RNase III)|nr:macro domain-containing protein [Gammaproteobacteria bacterium]MBP6053393.1 macro domain-containing protein [Pseudomonadales bacterium]MBK6585202.1 macro domain-containing protein [Gammaproteobacteria bacterium]MBK7169079.1 macro domain-containing protein [Gammaproteobacteria bacterium]MBK7520075.1 macro domain-containing protein [Gammaproteobacteria bacterium]